MGKWKRDEQIILLKRKTVEKRVKNVKELGGGSGADEVVPPKEKERRNQRLESKNG